MSFRDYYYCDQASPLWVISGQIIPGKNRMFVRYCQKADKISSGRAIADLSAFWRVVLQQSCKFACNLHFPHDPARVIHNADACVLD
jgi:hypothetical protein